MAWDVVSGAQSVSFGRRIQRALVYMLTIPTFFSGMKIEHNMKGYLTTNSFSEENRNLCDMLSKKIKM